MLSRNRVTKSDLLHCDGPDVLAGKGMPKRKESSHQFDLRRQLISIVVKRYLFFSFQTHFDIDSKLADVDMTADAKAILALVTYECDTMASGRVRSWPCTWVARWPSG